MEHCSAIIEVLLYLSVSLQISSAVTHTLQYLYTALRPAINFPEFIAVGLMDGEQFVYYDSNITKMIPKTEWIQKIEADVADYWDSQTVQQLNDQDNFKFKLDAVMQLWSLKQTEGVHTLQMIYGCELNDDSTTRGYEQYGFDGEDFISLDLKTGTWTAANDKAEIKEKWGSTEAEAQHRKSYLETECIQWLKKYMSYSRETLERTVPPTASVFQKHSSSPDVVCHATGFFPKTVNITWQKDGEDVHEDVDLRETLPNQDGSFQKRSILTVSAEDLQKHTYTCVIQHSSLEKEIVLHKKDLRILNPGGGSGGAPIGIIIGVVAALVVLVAVVAGIVVWKKKKNSEFTAAPDHDMT
ncbi:RLA class I histocompatibility antigen, alpha chain 11/11 isoform X2 [Ictalurus punctatus]|uniref:RLA class I histocompatibility antigen, alpha chain 11/11 isoform X2 n=1 Tax=Ictalurus punctatus TaxID=7998 RepID=A0A2D0PPX1_ICTPU|nr:RLA class I histocompatibility antigen, alpha chain 11/11 isoform X2 [Ictalurus punctatus]